MTEFVALLALYCACDADAATRILRADESAQCLSHYETIKSHYSQSEPTAPAGTLERSLQDRAAFARFKAWEAANQALVETLRDRG